MKFILIVAGLLAILAGFGIGAAAKSAIHEIEAAQSVIGGLALIGLAVVAGAIERAADWIVKAIDEKKSEATDSAL